MCYYVSVLHISYRQLFEHFILLFEKGSVFLMNVTFFTCAVDSCWLEIGSPLSETVKVSRRTSRITVLKRIISEDGSYIEKESHIVSPEALSDFLDHLGNAAESWEESYFEPIMDASGWDMKLYDGRKLVKYSGGVIEPTTDAESIRNEFYDLCRAAGFKEMPWFF